MKKIINNPKAMVICSIILLVVSFIIMQVFNNNLIDNCITFILYGNFILLIYFLLIISKTKYININLMNNILLINYVAVLLIDIYNSIIKNLLYYHFIVSSSLIITRILLYVSIIITLIIIFFSKTKTIIKPNIFTTILIILYAISLYGQIHYTLVYGMTKSNLILYNVLTTIYYVPMFLYFRLYAINKLKKLDK